MKKEKPTKSPREPPKFETNVRKSITSTWQLQKRMSINFRFKMHLSANSGLECPNAKEDSKVHVRLPLQVIDPDGDGVWDDNDG